MMPRIDASPNSETRCQSSPTFSARRPQRGSVATCSSGDIAWLQPLARAWTPICDPTASIRLVFHDCPSATGMGKMVLPWMPPACVVSQKKVTGTKTRAFARSARCTPLAQSTQAEAFQ